MSFFIKHLVSQRLKRITVQEILMYADEYGFSIQQNEAEHIQHVLRTTDFDPLSTADHRRLFQQLALITNEETAEQADHILQQLLKEKGFDHYLY